MYIKYVQSLHGNVVNPLLRLINLPKFGILSTGLLNTLSLLCDKEVHDFLKGLGDSLDLTMGLLQLNS